MKAYVKSYGKIKETGTVRAEGILVESNKYYDYFIPYMREFCNKGPFEFKKKWTNDSEWFSGKNLSWHISWLNPVLIKNGQYLLDFE